MYNENKLLCSETGVWVGDSVSCSIITCPNPSQVLNGRAIYADVTYNNEVDYICNDGYHLVGDGRLRCSETGAWDKTVPTCEPVNCGAPDFIAFAIYPILQVNPTVES
jgi:CUB/sushi domain-containing protein